MKTFVLILFSLSLFSPAFSQTPQRSGPHDTTLGLLRPAGPSTALERPIVILPLTFALTATNDEPVLSLYQTFAGTPRSFAWQRNQTIDLTAPLNLQLKNAEKELPWRISLEAAGTAGALYIAYKHIKKYGLK
ncbi:MAG: hypothetical protein WCI84_01460 [Bacteroidota bacterium]